MAYRRIENVAPDFRASDKPIEGCKVCDHSRYTKRDQYYLMCAKHKCTICEAHDKKYYTCSDLNRIAAISPTL